jgi:hypothetical protein
VFFVVPDAWIGAVGLVSRRGAAAVLSATIAGALVGGATTYAFAASATAATSARVLGAVPTVSEDAIDRVEAEMRSEGLSSLLRGPLRFGTPYKLYARAAAVDGRSFLGFLLWSIPARLLRMLPVALAAILAGALARRWIAAHARHVLAAYGVAWVVFYAYYAARVGV